MDEAYETILQDIDEARRALSIASRNRLPTREYAALADDHRAAMKGAVGAFARLNGWRRAPEFFDLDRLGHGVRGWDDNNRDRRLLDHSIWFYKARRFIAAVGQPYPGAVDLAEQRVHLTERGLVLHVPPDPLASIHYPGGTLFVVVTKPGVEVQWLPEQDGRLKARWEAQRVEAARQRAEAAL